jgi:hypothetical protein
VCQPKLKARALEILLSKFFLFCSYFGIVWVSGGCKKIGPKIGFSLNWSSHPSGISTVKTFFSQFE